MRVIGVSRTLNEAPLIEPFVRHHQALFDLHIILDNGSTDDTVPILRLLHAEGQRIEVYQSLSTVFVEAIHRIGLYRLAHQAGADWVLFLDCDELLDTRRLPAGLKPWLAALPAETEIVQVPMLDYVAPSRESATEPLLFERLVRRKPAAHSCHALLRRLEIERVQIGSGAHNVFIDGELRPGMSQDALVLAHYPDRSPAQAALKAAIGRLKLLADGTTTAPLNYNWHYVAAFEAMQRTPRQWLAEAVSRPEAPDLVLDTSPYLGGALRHTLPPDDDARLVALLLTYAERLARSHGDLLDRTPGLRDAVLQESARARRLL